MRVLVACEESQAVTIEFRKLGHEAYSCDIEPCSGGHPEWHIQGNALRFLNPVDDGELVAVCFSTMDDKIHIVEKWDMILAFPPCTYLTNTGNRWFNIYRYGEKAIHRLARRREAIAFFMEFVNADCDKIAIENPVGVMSTVYRKPNQIIHPYMFGDPHKKATCLWTKGLPPLVPSKIVTPNPPYTYKNGKKDSMWHVESMHLSPKERARVRSKTYAGIAKAMAEQWSKGCD